jgi:hypothetical protein
MMEAANSFEILVFTYQTARRHTKKLPWEPQISLLRIPNVLFEWQNCSIVNWCHTNEY